MFSPEAQRYFKDNIGLMHKAATKIYPRFMAVDPSFEMVDLEQELTLIFYRCYERHDPAKGKFSTFFTSACHWEMNRKIDNLEKGVLTGTCVRLDMTCEESDSEGRPLHNVVASDEPSALELLIANEDALIARDSIGPFAQKIFDLCMDPPEWLLREHQAEAAHQHVARAAGRKSPPHADNINAVFVARTLKRMGTDDKAVRQAMIELEDLRNGF